MSREQQHYQQKTISSSRNMAEPDTHSIHNKNGVYYPFQTTPNYYYNYMHPYPDTPLLPFFPPPFLPFEYFPPNPPALPLPPAHAEQRLPPVKAESTEEPILVKVQERAEKVEKQGKDGALSPSVSEQRQCNKQLYPYSPFHSKFFQLDTKAFIPRFKKVLALYIQEVEEEEAFSHLYRTEFPKEMAQNLLFFEELMASLSLKIRSYKKTKEELIKFIIRRTYHNLRLKKNSGSQKPEYERLQLFHQRNLAAFKSMNIQFLRRQFSNPLFVHLYKQFLGSLDLQFEIENEEKVERVSYTLLNCWNQQSTKLLLHERKLPWVNSYKWRIKKIALELLKEYQGVGSKEDGKSKAIDK